MSNSSTVGLHDVEWDIGCLIGTWGDLKRALPNWDSETELYRIGLDFDWGRVVVQCLPTLREAELTEDQRERVRNVLRDVEPFVEQIDELDLRVPAPELMEAFLEPAHP